MSEFVQVPYPESTVSPAASTMQCTTNVLTAHIAGAAGGISVDLSGNTHLRQIPA